MIVPLNMYFLTSVCLNVTPMSRIDYISEVNITSYGYLYAFNQLKFVNTTNNYDKFTSLKHMGRGSLETFQILKTSFSTYRKRLLYIAEINVSDIHFSVSFLHRSRIGILKVFELFAWILKPVCLKCCILKHIIIQDGPDYQIFMNGMKYVMISISLLFCV